MVKGNALLREPAEILGRPPEIHNIDRTKGGRLFALFTDRGQRRARHGTRSLDAVIDIRALSGRPRSGEFGGIGRIADRSHLVTSHEAARFPGPSWTECDGGA